MDWIFSIQTIKGKRRIEIPVDEKLFGIDLKYKHDLYNQIFDFVYYSEGAFSFDEVRDWPVTLRNHMIKRLSDVIEKKNKEMQKAKGRKR